MKITAIIEARMSSRRLPGKVLLSAHGKPMLSILVDRVSKVPSLNDIVLATTVNPQDDILEAFAFQAGIKCFRGSEENVMQRVIEAAKSVDTDVIVELTGDNPLIDPEIIEQAIQLFIHNPCDYVSNAQVRSYPVGMDVQVYRLKTLEKSYSMTQHPLDLEHVTRHIRLNPQLFKQIHLVAPFRSYWPELSLTMDEQADYDLIKMIIEHFSDTAFSCKEIIDLLKEKTSWHKVNESVKRKGLHA